MKKSAFEMVCPRNCGYRIPVLESDKYCRGCGSLLISEVDRKCPKCKTIVFADDIYCGKCGERYC